MKIMKHAIAIYIVLFLTKKIQAQTVFIPFVNVNSGTAKLGNSSIYWSFGETAMVNTLVNENGLILSAGLLQPTINVSDAFSFLHINDLKLIVGPNPVNNNCTLFCNQLNVFIESIQVTDAFGQLKQIFKGPFSGINFKMQIPFVSVNTGIYFIVIHYIVDNKFYNIKTYKIIKT